MKRTIDREQQQGRLGTEDTSTDGRAGRDLVWIVAIGIVVVLVAFASHTFQNLVDWAGNLSGHDLNGLLALLVVVPIGAGIFAVRRYHDARTDRETLFRLSFHDPLTGLPNRRFLGDGLDQMLKQTRRVNGRIAVLFIDLDGFPEINTVHISIFSSTRSVRSCSFRLPGNGRVERSPTARLPMAKQESAARARVKYSAI